MALQFCMFAIIFRSTPTKKSCQCFEISLSSWSLTWLWTSFPARPACQCHQHHTCARSCWLIGLENLYGCIYLYTWCVLYMWGWWFVSWRCPSIIYIYIEPSVSIVRWWEDRCKKSWSQPILWHWKGRSAYFSFCNEPGQLTSEVLTAMPHIQVYPPSSLLQLYMKRHIPFKLFQNHTIHLGLWWLSQTTTWF